MHHDPPFQNIPIPRTPEQRDRTCRLKELILTALDPDYKLKQEALERVTSQVDYASFEIRIAELYAEATFEDVRYPW